MDMPVYSLPTFQGNAAFKDPSWEFHPPAARFSRAYRPGRPAACLFWPPVLSHFTLWPEPLRLSEITAEAVSKAFVCVWVSRIGSSHQITTDLNKQFESRLLKILATITGSSLSQTTAWHPASNDMIERLHRQLKAALLCHVDEHRDEALPLVLLGIRSAWKKDLKAS